MSIILVVWVHSLVVFIAQRTGKAVALQGKLAFNE